MNFLAFGFFDRSKKWPVPALAILVTISAMPVHAEDLNAALAGSNTDQNLLLGDDSNGNGILIAGRTVTISGGEDRRFIAPSGQDPLFVIGEGGHLVLSDFQVQAKADGGLVDQALLFVDGGSLELSDCSIDAAWRFAIYVRSGSLKLSDCEIFGSEFGVVAAEGASVAMERAYLAGQAGSAVSLRGNGTTLELSDSQVTQARQGISASSGAQLTVKDVAFSAFEDAALFLDGVTASLDGVSMEEIANVGLYAAGNTTLDMRGGHSLGPTKTAINLQQVEAATIFGHTVEDAELGVFSGSGSGDVKLADMRFVSANPDHRSVITNAGSTAITTSWFIGGAEGLVWDSGVSMAIDSSIFAGQANTAIRTRDIGETETGIIIRDITVFSGADTVAVEDARGKAEISDSIFVHMGEAIRLAGNGAARLNSFFGAQELSVTSSSGRMLPSGFLNATIEPTALPELWSRANGILSGEIPAAQMTVELDSLIPAIQAEFVARETDYGVSLLGLDAPEFPPASTVEVANLERVAKDGSTQDLGAIRTGDFPLEILPGTYRIETSGKSEEVTLYSNEEYRIEYRRPDGPYVMALENEKPVSGQALVLLEQDKIRELVSKRWPGHNRFSVSVVPKYGTSAQSRDASLAYARENIAKAVGMLGGLPDEIAWEDMNEQQKAVLNSAQYGSLPQLLDIMRAAGSADDADALFERYRDLRNKPLKAFVARRFLSAAVEIWLRLGMLSDSPAARELASLDDRPENAQRLVLATALGRVGHAPAIRLLVDEIAVGRNGDRLTSYDATDAFNIVSSVAEPAVLALSLDVVSAFDAYGRARLSGQQGEPNFEGMSLAAIFPFAYMHAAAHANGEDRKRLEIAFPPWEIMLPLAPMFANPQALYDNYLGNTVEAKFGFDIYSLSSPICSLHIGRSPSESEAMSETVSASLRRYMIRAAFEDPDSFSRDVEALGRASCSPERGTMKYLKAPEKSDPDLLPTYMRYAFRPARHFLPDYEAQPDANIWTYLFDSMPDARFEPLAQDESLRNKSGFARYLNYRAVARSSDVMFVDRFPGLDDVRIILEPVTDPGHDNPQFWFAAKVSLSPRVAKGKSLFGVGLQTAFRDDNGLAGLITQNPAAVERMTRDFGRAMIKTVRLRHGDDDTELEFLQTTANGTHVFALPDGQVSDANLIVDVVLHTIAHDGVETHQRVVSFPLYDSPFGYDRMRREGRISLQ